MFLAAQNKHKMSIKPTVGQRKLFIAILSCVTVHKKARQKSRSFVSIGDRLVISNLSSSNAKLLLAWAGKHLKYNVPQKLLEIPLHGLLVGLDPDERTRVTQKAFSKFLCCRY